MNTKYFKILLIFIYCSGSITLQVCAQKNVHTLLSSAQKDSLKNEMETMFTRDQQYRWMFQFGETDADKIAAIKKLAVNEQLKRMTDVRKNLVGISQQSKDSLWQLQVVIDSVNFVKMSTIIREYGYPKKYVDADKVTAILTHNIQRFITPDFLKILKEEVINGNMPGLEYATIYDQVQQNNKLPELYCVMEHYNRETNTSAIGTPTDIAATNRARAEIGLKKLKN